MRTTAQIAAIALLTTCLHAQGIAPQRIAGGTFEASGVAHIPGTSAVLFVDDGRTDEIFWMDLDADGQQQGPVVPIPLMGASITDMEGMTFDGARFHYVVGSQSKRAGTDGDGLVRFVFDPRTRQISHLESVRGLKRWLADHVQELHGTGERLGDRVLNIEAVAWDPLGARLLLGLRAPVVDGHALVIPIRLRDASAPLAIDNLVVDEGKTIRLPLAGDGIRSLEYDDRTRSFKLIAGASLNAENRDFRVVEWNGDARSPVVRELNRMPRTLKPEGLAFGTPDPGARAVVVFDTGRFALLP